MSGAVKAGGAWLAGRVEGTGQARRRGRAVEDDKSDPGRAERACGFGGPAVQPGRGVGASAVGGTGLAEHDEHLAPEQVAPIGQLGEEGGVGACRGLKGGVRESGRGVEEGVDGGREVDRLGPYEELGGLVEPVEPAGEAGHQRLLLGRGAQAEGDRAGPTDHRLPVGAEIDDPVAADPGARQAQRHRLWSGVGGEERRRGRDVLGGRHQAVRGAMVAPGRGHPPVGSYPFEPAERQHGGNRSDRQGERAVGGGRHKVAGGRISGPQRHRGDTEDGKLAGGQPGQQLVRPLEIGGDTDASAVTVAVAAGGHSPTPPARALAPL